MAVRPGNTGNRAARLDPPHHARPRPPLSHTPSRRQFLAAAATLAVPTILPRSVFGANEAVVTGHIGVGNQGMGNLKAFRKNAAAVCEVDSKRLAGAAKTLELFGVSKPLTFKDY